MHGVLGADEDGVGQLWRRGGSAPVVEHGLGRNGVLAGEAFAVRVQKLGDGDDAGALWVGAGKAGVILWLGWYYFSVQ